MKKTISFLLILVSFCACSHRNQIIIEGQVENGNRRSIYLSLLTNEGPQLIDSTVISDNTFRFVIKPEQVMESTRLEEPAFYQLSLSFDNGLTTIAKAGETITLTANADKLVKSYRIKGSEDAALMWQLDSALSKFISRTDTLLYIYNSHREDDSVRSDVEQRYNQLTAQHSQYLRSFINRHPQSMSSIIAFYQVYNKHKFLDETEDADIFELMTDSLTAHYPNNSYISFLQSRIIK